MSGGEFDWGGRLRKGIGGAQRFPQNGRKPFEECKGRREQLENGTLKRDLERHGWKVEDGKADEPSVTDWIRRNSSAGRIFTMPEFRKTNIRTGVFC